MCPRPPRPTLFPYTTLFRSLLLPDGSLGSRVILLAEAVGAIWFVRWLRRPESLTHLGEGGLDRKSTRLNSSHLGISYAVFCLKKKRETRLMQRATCKSTSRA